MIMAAERFITANYIENINLESIEHHCKYKDPELHKSEILKSKSQFQLKS
jgi:hypothetical protein